MTRFQSNMILSSTILLIIALCLPKNGYSVEANNPLADNAKQNENPNVASLISLSYSCQGNSVTSTTANPGNRETIYTEEGYLEIIANVNNNNNAQSIIWFLDGELVQTGNTRYVFDSTNKVPGKYKIEAKLGESKKAIFICILKCEALRVDASAPSQCKIYYRLLPNDVEVNGQFSIQNICNISRNVENDFIFEFNQNSIVVSKDIVFSFQKDSFHSKSITIPLFVRYKDKSNDTYVLAYYLLEGVGVRMFHWSITDLYVEYK